MHGSSDSVFALTSPRIASEDGQEILQRWGKKEAGAANMIQVDWSMRQHVSEKDEITWSLSLSPFILPVPFFTEMSPSILN